MSNLLPGQGLGRPKPSRILAHGLGTVLFVTPPAPPGTPAKSTQYVSLQKMTKLGL